MRKFLAYIFLLILSYQVVPIKELGKSIASGWFTEEVGEKNVSMGIEEDHLFKVKKHLSARHLELNHNSYSLIMLQNLIDIALHYNERVSHQHFPDIFTPPPNILAFS
jgi:hypothetical protein